MTSNDLVSAFYGLDDAVPFLASYRICGVFFLQDGMPVIFPKEVDLSTLDAGDFTITLESGEQLAPDCATPAPAEDLGEFRTMLLIGDFGSINNQPTSVEITGNIVSLDQTTNFIGSRVDVTPLEDGPSLVIAESVPDDQWKIGKTATNLPFGGGDGCPKGTKQIIRAVWNGGITKPGGGEIGDNERLAYQITVEANGAEEVVRPFAISDLGDGDNNHELCLDQVYDVMSIQFPAGLMTDPRDDLNPATSVALSR